MIENILWHFYALEDGRFSGRSYSAASDEFLTLNTPDGCGAKTGVKNWKAQRVDLATGELVDYRPPAPDDDHVWDEQYRCHVLKVEVAERNEVKAAAGADIVTEERKLDRTLREFVLSIAPSLKLNPSQQALLDRLSAGDQRITQRALETDIRKKEVK